MKFLVFIWIRFCGVGVVAWGSGNMWNKETRVNEFDA